MNVAIIPARGGSKRIPRKNIKDFLGKPIIAYSIEAARAAGIFEAIIVSTDDEEVARMAVANGAVVPFQRPAELANDTAATLPVIQHAIDQCREAGRDADAVCCIYPCAPLLDPDALRTAFEILQRHDDDRFVFPVMRYPSAIERALRRAPDGEIRPAFEGYAQRRSQDLEEAFYDAGQFYFGSSDAWRVGNSIHANARTIVLPPWRAVDIDTPEDWAFAERLVMATRQIG